jgi:hypothetical protein
MYVEPASVMQTPMFHAKPARFAELLPGYGPTRVMLEGSYSHVFNAGFELALALVWAAALITAVYFVLRRARSAPSRPTGSQPLSLHTLLGYRLEVTHDDRDTEHERGEAQARGNALRLQRSANRARPEQARRRRGERQLRDRKGDRPLRRWNPR